MRRSNWLPSSVNSRRSRSSSMRTPAGSPRLRVLARPIAARLRAIRSARSAASSRPNRPLDAETAAEIAKLFVEVVIAPDADADARAHLAERKNLRLLLSGDLPDPSAPGATLRSIAGGYLLQSRDGGRVGATDLTTVTRRTPNEQELVDLLFAFTVAKHVKSNAIVYAKDGATVGIGAGPNEPRRCRAHCRRQGPRRRHHGWFGGTAHRRLGGGLRCVLPVCRWPEGGGRGGGNRRDSTGPARAATTR